MSDLPITDELLPKRFSLKTISAMAAIIALGAINVVLFKMQTTDYKLPKDSVQIQVFIIFAGQYLNILIFYLKLKFRRKSLIAHLKKNQRKAIFEGKLGIYSRARILIASILNFFAISLQLKALTVLPPLFFQMFIGFGTIFTPFVSRIFLKKRMYFHTLVGILISLVGFVCLFFTTYVFNIEDIDFDGSFMVASVVLLLSLLISSSQGVYEEWLSDKIVISSSRFVGLEGVFGLILLTISAIFFHLYSRFSKVSWMDIGLDVVIVFENRCLLFSSLFLIGSCTIYELSSITLTRKLSATFRMMNDILKIILIWVAQILFFDLSKTDLDLKRYLLYTTARLMCYALLILGNILINEICELSCLGLDRYFGRYHNTKMKNSLNDNSEEYSIVKF